MLIIRYLFALLVFLQAQQCDEKQNVDKSTDSTENVMDAAVQSITVQHHGGMIGLNEVMVIDAEKIIYTFKNVANPKPQTQEQATSPELWNQLLTYFDQDKFAALKDGNTHVVYDGTDNIYTISGSFGELEVTNPEDNSKELNDLFELLNAKRHEFYMNVAQK